MTLPRLSKIHVAGFRSLKDVTLEPTGVTVLIGPNGAGKSNLLWALEMVRLLAYESLQLFVTERGGATYLMHYGPKQTAAIDLELEFETEGGHNRYEARLGYGADESLLFLSERAGHRQTADEQWRWTSLGAGHRESKLMEAAAGGDVTAKTVRWLLRQVNFYHFHDTSRRSPLRTKDFADASGDYLRSDGSNLATFLEGIRNSEGEDDQASWRLIEGTLRRVAPFIRQLVPTRDRRGARLEWVDERGAVFGPAHLSDGTLRAIALITALAQPSEGLPLISCIDEPELGLHPSALALLCALISRASTWRQVIVATQSPVVLDEFEADNLVVVERHDGQSKFRRLSSEALEVWLADYSLSELYDKNVLGGRP